MNLILLQPDELRDDMKKKVAVLADRRARHIIDHLQKQTGETVKIGVADGLCGNGTVTAICGSRVTLQCTLHTPPPEPLPLELVLALPRPKMLRRLLPQLTALGLKKIHLIRSWRVEKSYFSSPLLHKERLQRCFNEGLEQSRDTVSPELFIHPRFRPFAEDILPRLLNQKTGIVLHPAPARPLPASPPKPALLLIGPEGGWVDFELELFSNSGCQQYSFGERILRVDTALLTAAGRWIL